MGKKRGVAAADFHQYKKHKNEAGEATHPKLNYPTIAGLSPAGYKLLEQWCWRGMSALHLVVAECAQQVGRCNYNAAVLSSHTK